MNNLINKVSHRFGKHGHQYAADCTCKKSKIVILVTASEAKEFEAGDLIPKPVECIKCKRLIQLIKPRNVKK